MPTINQLPLLTEASSGDQLPVYTPVNGDTRRLPLNTLLQFFTDNFTSPVLVPNLYAPLAGFSLDVPQPAASQWMILQPVSTLASGTITLPLNTTTPDGTEVLITSTQIITTLTIGLNGAANVFGAPTTLAANGFARLRYVAATNSWYRIG
jgi:hypothetical protein